MKLLVLLSVLILSPQGAWGTVLGEVSVSVVTGVSPATPLETRAFMAYGFAGPWFGPALFDDHLLTVDSVGQTFSATPATDVDFDFITARLTDGIEESLSFGTCRGFGCGFGWDLEQNWFAIQSVDFAGSVILEIQLTVDELVFLPPGELGETGVQIRYTVRILGGPAVPGSTTSWSELKALY